MTSNAPRKEVISYYQSMIELAKKFKWANYKDFFIRKANYDMNNLPPMQSSYYKKKLEELNRIVQVENLYSEREAVKRLEYSDAK